jgi:Tol biopolymer transport system component
MESLGGVASFVVYQAGFPIDDGNKATAQRQVATSLHAPVDLFPGSGVQHFRVEAVNVLGEAGPLSDELAIDTTSRIGYIADHDAENDFAIHTMLAVPGAVRTEVSPSSLDWHKWSFSPDGRHIAYAPDESPEVSYGLYVVPATGGTSIPILDPAIGIFWAWDWSWSPDGSRIAYRADPPGPETSYQLWTVPAVGGSAVRVNDPTTTSVAEIPGLSWSPDGSRLAYVGIEPVTFLARLYSAPADGGGATELSGPFPSGADGVTRFAWSPNGSQVAYIADQETTNLPELWVVPAGGGTPLKISAPLASGGYVNGLAWSPDGTRIAYRSDPDADTLLDIFVVPASGGASIRLSEDGGDWWSFEWSPDGSYLAYSGVATQDGRRELRVVPAVGGDDWRVSLSDSRGTPYRVSRWSWSPNGEQLAYTATASTDPGATDYRLYVTPFDRVEENPSSHPAAVSAFAWSPDGSRIVYLTDEDPDELWLVSVSGGGPEQLVGIGVRPRSGVRSFAWSPLGN